MEISICYWCSYEAGLVLAQRLFLFQWRDKHTIFIYSSIHWSSVDHQLFPVRFRTSSWSRFPTVAKTEFSSSHFFESFVWGVWTSVIFFSYKLRAVGEMVKLQREQYGSVLPTKRKARSLIFPASSRFFWFVCPLPPFSTRFFGFRCEQCHTVNFLSNRETNLRLPSGLKWQNWHGAVECLYCIPASLCRRFCHKVSRSGFGTLAWRQLSWRGCSGKPYVPEADTPKTLCWKRLHRERTCEEEKRVSESSEAELTLQKTAVDTETFWDVGKFGFPLQICTPNVSCGLSHFCSCHRGVLQWLSISSPWPLLWTLMMAVSRTTEAAATSWSRRCSCPARETLIPAAAAAASAAKASEQNTCCSRYVYGAANNPIRAALWIKGNVTGLSVCLVRTYACVSVPLWLWIKTGCVSV